MSFNAINKYFTEFLNESFETDEERLEAWSEKEKDFKKFFNKKVNKKQRVKKVKREGEPKGNKNSYMLFCAHVRPILAQDKPDLKGKHILSEMGRMWREDVTEKEKKKYEGLAQKDKERFKEEKEKFDEEHPPGDDDEAEPVKKSKKTKDPDAPKKPVNGYLLYCSAEREHVKKESGLSGKELKEKLTENWNGHRDSKDKVYKKYQTLADKDKERYKTENEEYLANKPKSDDDEPEKPDDDEPEKPKKKTNKKKKAEESDDEAEKEDKPKKVKKNKKEQAENDEENLEEEEHKAKKVNKKNKKEEQTENEDENLEEEEHKAKPKRQKKKIVIVEDDE